jgi:hypothetical protein
VADGSTSGPQVSSNIIHRLIKTRKLTPSKIISNRSPEFSGRYDSIPSRSKSTKIFCGIGIFSAKIKTVLKEIPYHLDMEMAMRKFRVVILSLIIFFLTYNVSLAQNRKAPEWIISEWINGPGVTLGELKGQVVIVEFFQLW